MNRVCVLMYHGIRSDDGCEDTIGTDDPAYTITASTFARHIRYLRENEYRVQSLQQYLSCSDSGSRTVIMTFDDGNKSDCAVALPILQAHGFAASFYVTTAWIGRPGFMNEADILSLHNAGMEIGSHGDTHTYFDELSTVTLTGEIERSTSVLEQIVDVPVRGLCLPGGRGHPRLLDTAREAGIHSISTSRPGMFSPSSNLLAIPRMPVQSTTTMDEFRRMVSCDRSYYRYTTFRFAVLHSLKKIFGNRRYDILRSRLLRRGDI